MFNNSLRCLVFDIETFPMEVRVWQLGEQRVNADQIVKDWSVAAWAAKWLGDPASSVTYYDTSCNKDVRYDKNILERLWKLLDEADIVVTQNGQNFDSKKLNARFIEHGMPPPKPYKHLDTYKIAKGVAEFTSHKLEYLTEKLNVKYKKLSHKKYPGRSLWDQCLAGNRAAWKEMKRYNIHDVLSTEELYMKLRAWTPESMPTPFVSDMDGLRCKTCGEVGRMQKRGIAVKNKFRYQRLQCQNCGKWITGDRLK
jgi:DNA polymerase III alpha subunit (gram-positive type)